RSEWSRPLAIHVSRLTRGEAEPVRVLVLPNSRDFGSTSTHGGGTLEREAILHTVNIAVPVLACQRAAVADIHVRPRAEVGGNAQLRIENRVAAGIRHAMSLR